MRRDIPYCAVRSATEKSNARCKSALRKRMQIAPTPPRLDVGGFYRGHGCIRSVPDGTAHSRARRNQACHSDDRPGVRTMADTGRYKGSDKEDFRGGI